MVKEYADSPVYTASNGCPVMNPQQSQRVGDSGPLLLQDFHLLDLLAHFDRERIPERYVFPLLALPPNYVLTWTVSCTPKAPAHLESLKSLMTSRT